MKTLKLTTYDRCDPVYVVASRVLSLESYTANMREGTKITLDGGEVVKVNEHITTVNGKLEDADGLTDEVIHNLATSCALAVAQARRCMPEEFDQRMSIGGFVKVIKGAM